MYRVRLDLVAIAMFISSRDASRSRAPVFATRTETICRRRASSRLRVRVLGTHHRPGARESTRSRARLRPRVPSVPLLVSRDEYLVRVARVGARVGESRRLFWRGARRRAPRAPSAPKTPIVRQSRRGWRRTSPPGTSVASFPSPERRFARARRRARSRAARSPGALRGCSAVMRHGGGERILRRLVIAPAAGLGAVPHLARGCLTLDGREGVLCLGGNRAGRGERRRPRRRAERPRRGTSHEPSGGRRACRGGRRWRSRACRARRAWTCRSRGGSLRVVKGEWGLGGMREGGARRPSSWSRAGKVARAPARNASVSFDRPFRRESFGRPNCMARRGLWAAPGAARRAPKVFQVTTCRRGALSVRTGRERRRRRWSRWRRLAHTVTRAHSLPASARLEHELRGGYQGYSRGASLPSRAPPRPVPPRASPSPLLASVHLFATSLLAHLPVVFPPFDRRRTSRPSPRARGSSVARARSARSLSTSSPACSR